MPTRNGKRLFGDEAIVTTAEKQHLDKHAGSVQAPPAAPRAQNEREAEKINSLRAEPAPVTEDKDAVIESLRADNKKVSAELAAANAQIARLKEQLAARFQVAPATFVTANSLRLFIDSFGIHDNVEEHENEPLVPSTNAGKPIKTVLKLVDGTGKLIDVPPHGFQVRATLHIEGSQTPLAASEVNWAERGGAGKCAPRGLNDPKWDGRLLWLSIGNSDNVFDMKSGTLELSAYIYPYYSELKKRKLVIHFSAVNHTSVTTAISIAVNNMSRTPNSRKTAKKQKTSPPLALPAPAMATLASAVGPSPPVAEVTPMEASGPAAEPSRADSGPIDVDNFLISDLEIFADENPTVNGDASTGYMSAPSTPPAGDKNLDGGASAEN